VLLIYLVKITFLLLYGSLCLSYSWMFAYSIIPQVNAHEYAESEDPALFTPRSNRAWGPLSPNWMEEVRAESAMAPCSRTKPFMCCYKLCRITCAFWGCQSRVEKASCYSFLFIWRIRMQTFWLGSRVVFGLGLRSEPRTQKSYLKKCLFIINVS